KDENHINGTRALIEEINKVNPDTLVIIQITHSGSLSFSNAVRVYPEQEPDDAPGAVLTQEEIHGIIEAYIDAAEVAYLTGADGVDVACCHGYLLGQFLRPANTRDDEFGGVQFDNRVRIMELIITGIKDRLREVYEREKTTRLDLMAPEDFKLMVRLSMYEGIKGGFGTKVPQEEPLSPEQISVMADEDLKALLVEPLELIRRLANWGVEFFNISAGIPYYNAVKWGRPLKPPKGFWVNKSKGKFNLEAYHHLRFSRLTKETLKDIGRDDDVLVIGSGFSLFGQDLLRVAQTAIGQGYMDKFGIGRQCLADPDIFTPGYKVCRRCGGCSLLLKASKPVGCAVYDKFYRGLLKKSADAARTRDGKELPPVKRFVLRIVSFLTYILTFGFRIGFPQEAFDTDAEFRLKDNNPQLKQTTDEVKTGRIRAGPRWLFALLDLLGIRLYGFNFNHFVILNPTYPQEYTPTIIHEIAAIAGWAHEEAEGLAQNIGRFNHWLEKYQEAELAMPEALVTQDTSKTWQARSRLNYAREELWLESTKTARPRLNNGILLCDIVEKRVFTFYADTAVSAEFRQKWEGGLLVQLELLNLPFVVRKERDALVAQLGDRSEESRREALERLKRMEEEGLIALPYLVPDCFQHCHTKYSYSPYYPEFVMWRGYQLGLQVVGIIDHDTVAGFRSFRNAARILGYKNATCGYEVRATPIDSPELMQMDINFPKVKGKMYIVVHAVDAETNEQTDGIRQAKVEGFQDIIAHINSNLKALGIGFEIEYERDIQPLAEENNPTERHLAEGIASAFKNGIPNITERVAAARSLVNLCAQQAEVEVALTDEETALIDEPSKFLVPIRNKVIVPLRNIYPLTIEECPSLEAVVEFAHKRGWLVYYPYLGGSPTICEAERPENIRKLFAYVKDKGVDGIAFMPDRNTPEQIEMIQELAAEFNFRLANGMDVNAAGMAFTNEFSGREDFVRESLAIVGHE
ncbi:MAG: hypothetical protein WC658_05155, partial [Candidatus Omnitrophota bacterium]